MWDLDIKELYKKLCLVIINDTNNIYEMKMQGSQIWWDLEVKDKE